MADLIPALALSLCGLLLTSVTPVVCLDAAELVAAPAADVTVPLVPFLLEEVDTAVTGAGTAFHLNLPLVEHIAIAADDIHAARLTISCSRTPALLTALAGGEGADGAVVALATCQGLSSIPLEKDERLAISAWKVDAHYNGGATLSDLRMVRIAADGTRQEDPLPKTFDATGGAIGALGRFTLVGLANRDRFPLCAAIVQAVPGTRTGEYGVPGSRGAGVSLNADGSLHLQASGRADAIAAYDWAPAVVFTPAQPGIYAIEGNLSIRVAKPGQHTAWIVGRLSEAGGPLAGVTLRLHRLLHAVHGPLSPSDYDATPIASIPLADGEGGKPVASTIDLSAAARAWMDGSWPDHGIALLATGADRTPATVLIGKSAVGELVVAKRSKTTLFDYPIKPRPGVYATMRDGRLWYGEQRLRLWGMVKDGPGERVRRLGFNCVRMWFQGSFYTPESAKRGKAMDAVPGDGSDLDNYDRMMADYKANGLFIMFATTVGSGTGSIPISAMTDDDSWLAGGDDWAAWKQAMVQAKGAFDQYAYVDERLWRVRLRHAQNVFDHRNPYTGKRYAEEEMIALVEINNEAGLVKNWLERGFAGWPDLYRAKLAACWNAWLAQRYPDAGAMARAWGTMDRGEEVGSVKLEPVLANRGKYPHARQEDFLRFVYGLIDARNQEYRSFCRSLAPAGVGTNVVPFSFDSQYRPSMPWTYSNWLGETSTVSMYFWQNESMLTSPPGLYVLDSHRTADRLSVIYETQRGRPSPYRAEYPYMLAAMTCWQDFDIVVWHGSWIGAHSDEELLAGTVMPLGREHFWNGVHLEHDPAMTSAVALAGRLFLTGAIAPAPKPVEFTVGRQAIFSYDAWNGIGGRDTSLATFTSGTRVRFKPEEDSGVLLDKSPQPRGQPAVAAVRSGDAVLWDWQNGRLIIDSPTAKVYVGRTVAAHRFSDGITLSGIETPFISFALVSADGKPLVGTDPCRLAWVSAVADARNTDFDFNYAVIGGPVEQAKAVRRVGHAPVIQDRVGYTLSFPSALTARLTGYDFAMREVLQTDLNGSNILRQPAQTLWMGALAITGRGAPCEPHIDPSPGVAVAVVALSKQTEATDVKLGRIPYPIPGLSWGDNYQRAHHLLRDSSLVRTGLSPLDTGTGDGSQIEIKELEGVFPQPVNADILFVDGRMTRLVAAFVQAPAFTELVTSLGKIYGQPTSSHLVDVASAQSDVHWDVRAEGGVVQVTATEVQGVVRLTFELAH